MTNLIYEKFKLKDQLNKKKLDNFFSNPSFLSVTSKLIHLSSHAFTLLLITNIFTPEEQGLFFLFQSLIALQIFVELGMGNVIQNFASHEAQKLRSSKNPKLTEAQSASDQLAYIFKIGLIWFFCGGFLLTFILIFVGSKFINATNTVYIGWELIWIITGLLISMLVAFQVFWSIIQGCNWVVEYHRFKIFQIFFGNLALWATILSNGKLWSIVAFIGVQVLIAIIYLLINSREFFFSLFKQKLTYNKLKWSKDLLPFQSLIFISFLSGYLAFNIQVPITSIIFGVEEAGRVGASWHLAGLISIISYAYVAPHGPQIAMWAQSRNYNKIKPYINKLFKNNFILIIGLGSLVFLTISAGKILKEPLFIVNLIERVGSVYQILLMVLGHIAVSLTVPISIYFRAHKREPIAHLSLLAGLCTLFGSYYLSIYFGVIGIGLGFFLSQIIILPMVVLVYRKEKISNEKLNRTQ